MTQKYYEEDYSMNKEYIIPDELRVDDQFKGWYLGVRQGKKGEIFEVKTEDDRNLVFPLHGSLKTIFFKHMDIKQDDYIRLIFKGGFKLTEGNWKGSNCFRWDVKRTPALCGTDAKMKHFGYTGEPSSTETEGPSDNDIDGVFA